MKFNFFLAKRHEVRPPHACFAAGRRQRFQQRFLTGQAGTIA
jgi:hypothetical protein